MKKTQQPEAYTVSPSIQKAFVAAAFALFVVQLGFMAYLILEQYPENSNFSAMYWFVGQAAIIPIIFFLLACYLRPKKLSRLAGLFEALLLTITGTLMLSALTQTVSQLRYQVIKDYDSFLSMYGIDLLAIGLTGGLYLGFLLYIRQKKLW